MKLPSLRHLRWGDDIVLPIFACAPAILAIGAVLARMWGAS